VKAEGGAETTHIAARSSCSLDAGAEKCTAHERLQEEQRDHQQRAAVE